jgi:outer membrane lipoprotein SlyB
MFKIFMKTKILLSFNLRTLFFALVFLLFCSCGYSNSNLGVGTLTGGAMGAGTGAIVGSATGNTGPGIAIGAGVGALSGALIGSSMDAQDAETKRLEEEQYRQNLEIERQNREIDEIRRQQRYDDAFQKY